jgi:N-acetylneuraminic acid mutarotase
MRATTVLSACVAVALLACTSEDGPTEPEAGANPALAAPSVAAASNTWTPRAPHNFAPLFGTVAGVAPNSAGQSIVYVFGGCDGEGLSGYCTGYRGSAYNVATDTWTGGLPEVSVYAANGVGTIGGKLYFSGGHVVHGPEEETWGVWAYDPAANQLIQRADMPRATAEGVTGVIGDKLYVLPGICNSNYGSGRPGYCKENPIRRLYRYDPATDKWVARRSAPHFHPFGAAGVIGGKFYVAGGVNSADLDVYDPATDTWKTLAPIPTAGQPYVGVIGTALQGKLYVVSGSKAYVYNPGTNKWSPIAAPTWRHEAIVRVVVDGKPRLLAVGGGNEIPNNSELYTP